MMNSLYLQTLCLMVYVLLSSSQSISQEPEIRDELENFLKLYRAKQAEQKGGRPQPFNAKQNMHSSDNEEIGKDSDISWDQFIGELPSINEYLEAMTLCTELIDRMGFSVDQSVIALSADEMKFQVCRVALVLFQLFTRDGDDQAVVTTPPSLDIPQRSVEFRNLLLGQLNKKPQYDRRSFEPKKVGLRAFDMIGAGPLQLGKRSIEK